MDFSDIHISNGIDSIRINNEKLKNINFLTKYEKEWDELDFSDNEFEDLKTISGIYCNKLILSNNNIMEISFLSCNIKCLEMEKCNIKKINFINTVIEILIINNNDIDELNLFPNNLKYLEIKNNNLSYFHYNELLINLEVLYLDNNNIEDFVFTNNNNLITLSLNNNSLNIFDINIITEKMELLNLLNNCFDIYDNDNQYITSITNIYTNLKLFIEISFNDITSNNNDDIIPKQKILFFQDSDESIKSNTSDLSDDDNYFNNDGDDDIRNIFNYNIVKSNKGEQENNKTRVEFRWSILM
jgi:hypothetical protein